MRSLSHLDLFSGIGGFSLAAQMTGSIETKQFVEINPYCQKVLTKNFPGVSIHGDITTFVAEPGRYDLITAGFPCQDISAANTKGEGLQGSRSSLFYEVIRLLCECRPSYLILENSPALLNFRKGRDMGAILFALSESGYDAEWSIVSGCSVGAPHARERLLIVAYSHSINGPFGLAIHSRNERAIQAINNRTGTDPWSKAPPHSSGMVNGLPHRMDRVRGLGNAVVPQVAKVAMSRVLEREGLVTRSNPPT